MRFLLSPFLALFSRHLYREALRGGVARALGYLAYLTLLFTLLAYFACQFLLLPITSSFIDWLVQVTPEMTLTRSGLDAKVTQPYLVKHPALGTLYLIDTNKSTTELMADSSGAFVLIGKENVIVRNPNRNETRIFDLKETMGQAREQVTAIQITKSMMKNFGKQLESLVIPLVLILLAPLFFIWKPLTALFYSLIALLLNLLRKDKLSYGSLLSLACFAITPVIFIQALDIFVPNLSVNLNFLLALGLTTAYLIYGMFAASRSSG